MSHQLVVSRNYCQWFAGGADYPTFSVSILVLCDVQERLDWIARDAFFPLCDPSYFGSLRSLDFSWQVGWPSAGLSRRLAD